MFYFATGFKFLKSYRVAVGANMLFSFVSFDLWRELNERNMSTILLTKPSLFNRFYAVIESISGICFCKRRKSFIKGSGFSDSLTILSSSISSLPL